MRVAPRHGDGQQLRVGDSAAHALREVEVGEDAGRAACATIAGEEARRSSPVQGTSALAVLVVLADHALGLAARIVVEVFLELALDDAALLLDHQDLALAAARTPARRGAASGHTRPTL